MDDADVVIAGLLGRARGGDPAAIGELLDAHRDYLRGLAAQQLDPRVRGRVDASDVVQQTCLSVYRQIEEFDGTEPAQFVAWLRQVHERNIRNVVRDQLQARKRSANREEPLGEREPDAGRQTTPSEFAVRGEERERLSAALALLPPDERAALRLRYLEDRTLPQISDELGMTKDAVVWLLKRAMKNVRGLLGSGE